MMTKTVMTALALLTPAVLAAAPAEKVDPVADGYPTWLGVTPKNYVQGRELCASDLRHKVTIVIELEPSDKLTSHFVPMFALTSRSSGISLGPGANWEDFELPRDCIAVISLRGMDKKDIQNYKTVLANKDKAIKDKSVLMTLTGLSRCPTYCDLTFEGAPDTTGKRPYVYVFGPTGATPLVQGPLATVADAAKEAIEKGKKEIKDWDPKWRPFFGNIAKPKFDTSLAKAIEKGMKAKKSPLDSVSKGLLLNVKSPNAEKAREAQILFDAIEQTRGDLLLRIQQEAQTSPHCAYYDMETVLKYWPAEKKRVEAASARLKANPEAEQLGRIYGKLLEWSRPEFVCKSEGEANKIVQELNKIKKDLEKPKGSKDITVQNGALHLDMKADVLISIIPTKVVTK